MGLNSVGSGHYAFFKSILNSNQRYAGRMALGRLNGMNVSLSGSDLESNKYHSIHNIETFNSLISQYLATLSKVSASLRTNEISYIENLLSQFKKDGKKSSLLSEEELQALEELKSPSGITYSNYQKLISALNKVKYNGDVQKMQETFSRQRNNIELLKSQFDQLDETTQKQVQEDYIMDYDTYKKTHGKILKSSLKVSEDNIQKYRLTTISELVARVNKILKQLDDSPTFTAAIEKAYREHLEDSKFDITNDSSLHGYIIDTIINYIEEEKNSTLKDDSILDTIINHITNNLDNLENSKETGKVSFRINNENKSVQQLFLKTNTNVVRLLLETENAEKIIANLFPENNQLLQGFKKIKQDLSSLSKTRFEKMTAELNRQMRDTLKSKKVQVNGKEMTIRDALSSGTRLQELFKEDQMEFLQMAEDAVRKLKIRVSKSPFAEKLAHDQVLQENISNIIFNKIGGQLNLKDDVYYAIDVPTLSGEKILNKNRNGLKSVLDDINKIITTQLDSYLENYYNATSSTKRKGQADVKTARDIYVQEMKDLYNNLKDFYNNLPQKAQKELDKYANESQRFLGSVSVKEYELYIDSLGYHGGTLGSTSMKAIQNIQDMYEMGGITAVDLKGLQFALLNCGDALLGGKTLRTSLENYLLGGAALMMFDEGYGEAIPYLEQMESKIAALMPKNLNLYALNQAYVPASYVLETIQQQLSKFYKTQLSEDVEEWTNTNRVVITNDATEALISREGTLEERFSSTAGAVESQISIQFLFMAGMLDIFKNLESALQVKT